MFKPIWIQIGSNGRHLGFMQIRWKKYSVSLCSYHTCFIWPSTTILPKITFLLKTSGHICLPSLLYDWVGLFDGLKNVLLSNLILNFPQTNKPYRLYTDACAYAGGRRQCGESDPVCFAAAGFHSEAMGTIEKQAYAIIYCL